MQTTIIWTTQPNGTTTANYNGFELAITPLSGIRGGAAYNLTVNNKVFASEPSLARAQEFAERLRPFMDNPAGA